MAYLGGAAITHSIICTYGSLHCRLSAHARRGTPDARDIRLHFPGAAPPPHARFTYFASVVNCRPPPYHDKVLDCGPLVEERRGQLPDSSSIGASKRTYNYCSTYKMIVANSCKHIQKIYFSFFMHAYKINGCSSRELHGGTRLAN